MFWEYTQSGLLTDVLMVGLTLKEASKLNKISSEEIHDYISSYQCSCHYNIYLAPNIQTTPKFGTQSGYFTL